MCHFEFQNLSSYQLSTFLWFFLSTFFVPPLCIRHSPYWFIVVWTSDCEFPHSVPSLSHWISSEVRTACFQVRWKPFWLLMVSPIMYRWYFLGNRPTRPQILAVLRLWKKTQSLFCSYQDLTFYSQIPQKVWRANSLSGASTKDFHTHQNRPECSIRIVGFC